MPLLLWNPINLIDGEGRWLFFETLIIIIALIASKLLGLFVSYSTKKEKAITTCAKALYTPALYLIWYLTVVYSFDLVTDQLLSQSHPQIWSSLLYIGIALALGWFLRIKSHLLKTS